MSEQVTMSVGVALVLGDVTKMLLYKKVGEENGQPVYADRELPFRLKYRLNKNKLFFDKDATMFNQRRLVALSKYGEPTPDGKNVVIKDPKKRTAFQKEISDLIDATVTHSLSTLSPEDIDLVEDTDMPISPEAMGIFISYMVDDPSLKEDVTFNVTLSEDLPPVEEADENEKKKTPVTKKSTTKKVEEPKVEEPKVEEVKTEAKKTTAKKTTSTKKATTSKKKTTTTEEKPKTKKTIKKVSENG